MKVEVSATDIDELQADDRGRVTLGAQYKNEKVTVAVLEVESDE